MVGCAALLLSASAGCSQAHAGPAGDDLGWVDDGLSAADRVFWPGIDHLAGRLVPFINGFGNDRRTGYWFLGVADRRTADVFIFCREGDQACPLDAQGRIAWETTIGRPMFSRVPGDPRYSPWWQVWTVRVADDFPADSILTVGALFTAVALDEAEVYAEQRNDGETDRALIVHLPMVLRGTTLEDNGGAMPDGVGRRLPIASRVGIRQGRQVEFFDFSASEGVFLAAPDSEHRPLMPAAKIYIYYRACDGESESPLCGLPGEEGQRRPVSERGLGQDITGDGDVNDSNNVIGSLPCEAPEGAEPPYSPLWAVHRVDILAEPGLRLIDDMADGTRSDMRSASQMQEAVAAGSLAAPVPATGVSPAEGIEPGPLFFNCPVPIAVDRNDCPEGQGAN